MLLKCICTNCSGHLEFEEENAGEQIQCPHCGWDTTLYDSKTGTGPMGGSEAPAGLLRRHAGKLVIGAVAAVALGSLGLALHRWVIPWLEGFFPFAEGRLMLWLGVVAGLWCLLFLALWTIFPVVAFLQLRRISTVLGQMEAHSRPAPVPEPEPVSEQPQEEEWLAGEVPGIEEQE